MAPKTNPDHNRERSRRDRGQNYALGFLIIFGIIATISLGGLVVGTDVLGSVSDRNLVQDGQSNMEQFHAETNGIATDGTPYREVELSVTDADLTYGRPVTINVTANDPDANVNFSTTYTTRTFVYEIPDEDTFLIYSFGALGRYQESGSEALLQKNPPFTTADSRTAFFIPVLTRAANSPSSTSVSGTSDVFIQHESGNRTVIKRTGTNDSGDETAIDGSISIEEPTMPNVWKEYFANAGYTNIRDVDTDSDGSPEAVRADFSSTRVFIRTVEITTTLNKQT